MDLHTTTGNYEPSFFIIRINSDSPVESIVQEHTSTFIHEYIHFLQDLTLPYCIRESRVRLVEFFELVEQAATRRELHMPSHLTDGDDFYVTKRQTELTWGSGTFITEAVIRDIDCTYEAFEALGFNVYKYVITTQQDETYHLGARDLLEYIAHKIEERHYPGGAALPALPYRSVDLVLDYSDLSCLSDTQRVALAEHCLINDNPVHRLMTVIDHLREGVFSDAELADDEKFIQRLQRHHWASFGVQPETIWHKVERRLHALKKELLKKFPEQAFPAVHQWLDKVTDCSLDRLAGRHMFTWMYAADTSDFKQEINQLLSHVGVPVIANKNQELRTSLGDGVSSAQFLQIWLAYEFSTYVKRRDLMCPMYDVCDRDQPERMDDDCMDAPFRRASDPEPCPFGAFIKAQKLDKVTWHVNGRVVPGARATPWS